MFDLFKSTVSDVEAACKTFLQGQEDLNQLRLRVTRVSKQIPAAQQRAQAGRDERDRCQKVYADSVDGLTDADGQTTLVAKAALTTAEFELMERREELRVLLDAQKSLYKRIDEQSAEVTKLFIVVKDLAEKEFKNRWSLKEAWKSGKDKEVSWRGAVLSGLLAQLSSANPSTVVALQAFFAERTFRVTVVRSFQNVRESPCPPVWSDELSALIDGGLHREIRVFKQHEELSVPGDLDQRMAFEQFFNGRLELVGA
jgi:hypothetical protein